MKAEYAAAQTPMVGAGLARATPFFDFRLAVDIMPHAELTQHVRQIVAEAFARAGMPQPNEFAESILIKGGNYCGRRFVGSGGHAVWFVEENQVKVYSADGRLEHVISTLVQTTSIRRAA